MTPRSSAFSELLRGLLDDLGRLLRGELRLARLEAEQKLRRLAGGLVFAIVAVVLAAQAAAAALAEALAPWLAQLLVAGAALLLCLFCLLAARRALAAGNLKPTRTLRSLSKDADAIQEAIHDVSR